MLVLLSDVPKWLQAIPAAVAAAAGGLNGVYHWREDSIRWLTTAQALRSELAAYKSQHPDRYGRELSPDAALDHFVVRVHELVAEETAQWQTLFLYRPRQIHSEITRRRSKGSHQAATQHDQESKGDGPR
jgi:hypothetical protein